MDIATPPQLRDQWADVFYSNAAKIRHLFVTPDAEKRAFFNGVNFEFSYSMPQFSDTRWNAEIRPIIGFRKGDYEFIVNSMLLDWTGFELNITVGTSRHSLARSKSVALGE